MRLAKVNSEDALANADSRTYFAISRLQDNPFV